MAERQSERPDPTRFLFRGLHPQVLLGTASDRYGGWIGQIYTAADYHGQIQRSGRRIGARTLYSDLLPIASVREYFRHFPVLELDFTFYAPLLSAASQPTRTHQSLTAYARCLQPADAILLKAPQAVFARKLRRGTTMVDNPDYLNADLFARRFYAPAVAILGESLRGIVFEQEYQRAVDGPEAIRAARELGEFFQRLPVDSRYHVELRTDRLLAEPVFEVLAEQGVGLVFSHWTWLPPLARQLRRCGGRFFNAAGDVVVRLLTPLKVRYQDAYLMAHPFNRLRSEMLAADLLPDTLAVAEAAVAAGRRVYVLVNNRAAGNAPLLAQRLAAAWIARHRKAEPDGHGR